MTTLALRVSRLARLFPYTIAFLGHPRRLLWFGVILTTLIAAAWQMENWRGRQRWAKVQERMQARGIALDWRSYHEKPVPNDLNVTRHPVFKDCFKPSSDGYGYVVLWDALTKRAMGPLPKALFKKHPAELEAWQATLRADPAQGFEDQANWRSPAEDVLWATRHFDAMSEELAEAFERPHSQWFPLDVSKLTVAELPTPQMSNGVDDMEVISAICHARALAYLKLRLPESARQELLHPLRLTLSMGSRGNLVHAAVQLAQSRVLMETLPRMLVEPGWRDEDLREIAEALEHLRIMESVDLAFKREFVGGMSFQLAWMRGEPWATRERWIPKDQPFLLDLLWRASKAGALPQGWHYQNLADFSAFMDAATSQYDAREQRVYPSDFASQRFHRRKMGPYNFISLCATPQISNFYLWAAETQTQLDLARVLCALQRYRLAQGHYPDLLQRLAPEYLAKLPHDYATGQAPRYELHANRLVLQSLDWDQNGQFKCRIEVSVSPDE